MCVNSTWETERGVCHSPCPQVGFCFLVSLSHFMFKGGCAKRGKFGPMGRTPLTNSLSIWLANDWLDNCMANWQTAWLCQLCHFRSKNHSAVQSSKPRSPAEISAKAVLSRHVLLYPGPLHSPARGREREGETEDLHLLFPQSVRRGGEAWRLLCSHTGQSVELTHPARRLVTAAYPATGVALPSLCLLPTNLINHSGDTAEHQPTQPLTHSPE